jgi:hypothetical protein
MKFFVKNKIYYIYFFWEITTSSSVTSSHIKTSVKKLCSQHIVLTYGISCNFHIFPLICGKHVENSVYQMIPIHNRLLFLFKIEKRIRFILREYGYSKTHNWEGMLWALVSMIERCFNKISNEMITVSLNYLDFIRWNAEHLLRRELLKFKEIFNGIESERNLVPKLKNNWKKFRRFVD